MKLIAILATAFTVAVLCSLSLCLYSSLTDKDNHHLGYAFIMIFANTVLPLLILTAVFSVVWARIRISNRVTSFILSAFTLFLLSVIGLSVMTITSPNPDYTFFSGLTFEKFRSRFESNYGGYMRVVAIASIILPFIYTSFVKKFETTNQTSSGI